jgi:hypothetical protein
MKSLNNEILPVVNNQAGVARFPVGIAYIAVPPTDSLKSPCILQDLLRVSADALETNF